MGAAWNLIRQNPMSSINFFLNIGIIIFLIVINLRVFRLLRLSGFLDRVEEWDRMQKKAADKSKKVKTPTLIKSHL
jgi:hypothetical protein